MTYVASGYVATGYVEPAAYPAGVPSESDVRYGVAYGPSNEYIGTMLTSAPTPEQIADHVLLALQASTIPVNMVQIKGQPITGAGSEADPWGP